MRPPRPTLTPARRRVLAAFWVLTRPGKTPSIREIGTAVGRSSSATVHGHLEQLAAMGYLENRRHGQRARVLTDAGLAALHAALVNDYRETGGEVRSHA